MTIDTLLLSRIQFGFTIGFHILFPTLNLGLAIFLSIMEGLWLKTRNPVYLQISKFWMRIFALTFGMGVVSGIVMAYELGTNFGHFTDAVGGVLGPLFSYEVLSAFFLEAGFLGVMLFGWDRVGPRLHYSATLLVTIGTAISAFWILAANSWMQTPSGYHLEAGKFMVDNWWHVIFNPSFIPRFFHMLLASYISTCVVIAGISSWFLLKGRHREFAQKCLGFALIAGIIVTSLQLVIGDRVGLMVHERQPILTAAIEGVWHTTRGAPLLLFAIPDQKAEKNLYELKIPYGASIMNTHKLDGKLIGLDTVPAADRPFVPVVFFTFRIMVGIGLLLFFSMLYGCIQLRRKRIFEQRAFLRWSVLLSPLGFIATWTGWITAEMGRQPWVVYQQMRTVDAASKLPISHVIFSLSLFIFTYLFIFGFYLTYLFKTIRKGPTDAALNEAQTAIYMGGQLPKTQKGGE